jgi:hypothetical protein
MTVYSLYPGHGAVLEQLIRQQLTMLEMFQGIRIQHEEAAILTTDANYLFFGGLPSVPFEDYGRTAEIDVAIGGTVITVRRHLKECFEFSGLRIKREHAIGVAQAGQFRIEWWYR